MDNKTTEFIDNTLLITMQVLLEKETSEFTDMDQHLKDIVKRSVAMTADLATMRRNLLNTDEYGLTSKKANRSRNSTRSKLPAKRDKS